MLFKSLKRKTIKKKSLKKYYIYKKFENTYDIEKSFRRKTKKQNNYSKFKYIFKKIFIIIILFLLFFIPIKRAKIETLIPSSLSPDEHYKILLPRIKYHSIKKFKLEDKYNLFKLEDSIDYERMKKRGNNNNYIYYSCVVTKAKYENLYVKEFVEHYLKLGVEKFYFGDDNPENIENLSDVLNDYIKKGIVDIEYIFNRNLTHYDFFEYTFRSVKYRCKWFLFYDVDEFLEFTYPNLTLQNYLDMPVFNKCDAIRIHWIMYDDNNLLYYDKRPLKERFNHSLPNNKLNIYHKSIVRGKDYNTTVFVYGSASHEPNHNITSQCDALGNIERLAQGRMYTPKYKYCYIRHHTYKTAEEFAVKLLRGGHQLRKYDADSYMNVFSQINVLTEEKLNLIEHIVNRTFPKYHKFKNESIKREC